MKYLVCVGLIIGLASSEASMDLPSSFKICRRSLPNYEDCLATAIHESIIKLGPGLKSFKILPIEPLAVDSITIAGGGSAVSLKQSYKNVKIHGLTRGLRVYDVHVNFEKGIIEYTFFHDQIDMVADYTVEGKILLLPVTGSGLSNITLLACTSKSAIYFENEEKDGELYLKVKSLDTRFAPRKVLLKFNNLFNGDGILGEQMNKFINQNSDLLFKELQGPFEDTFGLVFANLADSIFSRVPINKIFLP